MCSLVLLLSPPKERLLSYLITIVVLQLAKLAYPLSQCASHEEYLHKTYKYKFIMIKTQIYALEISMLLMKSPGTLFKMGICYARKPSAVITNMQVF